MNLYAHFTDRIAAALDTLKAESVLPGGTGMDGITVEPPRDESHGDLATNAAMVLAKGAGLKPRDLAEKFAVHLRDDECIEEIEVAGPGFINFRLSNAFWQRLVKSVLELRGVYGRSEMGRGQTINVEYVSANPTGPLHVGHCRGAVFGDALAALLEKAGYGVTREYYINDAGAQIDVLARSAYLRYREALGEEVGEIPEGLYPGDYLIPVGRDLAKRDGDKWLGKPEAEWLPDVRKFASDAMLVMIREDLKALGISFDLYFSEATLHEQGGAIDRTLDDLDKMGLIYEGVLEPPKGKLPEDWEPRPQTLFRATEFGDDVDRPLKKSDGSYTYFAADIAYHADKLRRGFTTMIDVWGADHGGYVKRMTAAVKALSGGTASLDVKLCQLVRLFRKGEPVRMSKRAGSFVTLREVVDEVGKDVVRFIMLTRKNDAPLDFDFAEVLDQSKDNPVFYVQYAHARVHSVMRNAKAEMPDLDLSAEALSKADFGVLTHEDEVGLIKLMSSWPRLVETAAEAHEPHRVAFYLYDLASAFHTLWNKGKEDPALRFIVAEDRSVTEARLGLIWGVATVIASGLGIMGVQPVEEMR
ncbi:MAG TPA: arginine--tRNA ligase [Alphaproteobacteria bacterium]|nr:arginine--tRNA ligase [Alphaproteobacteria bacterium]